jgi:hypothetical protein
MLDRSDAPRKGRERDLAEFPSKPKKLMQVKFEEKVEFELSLKKRWKSGENGYNSVITGQQLNNGLWPPHLLFQARPQDLAGY